MKILHEIRSFKSKKISKFVATRCQIIRLKCTKIDFGWGYAPEPTRAAYTALPRPWLDLKDLLLRGEREKRWREMGTQWKRRCGRKEEVEGKGDPRPGLGM